MDEELRDTLQAALGPGYVVERELGGGMSRVFLATERALNRRVVVKVLPPDYSAGVSHDRFRREIQVAARLQHPHIVPVLSTGEASGVLYYTMPFIEGESLRDLLEREHQLSVDTAVRIAAEVADALDYAHRHGIIHRDIKPENILLEDGHAIVADFGIARALDAAAGATLTGVGVALGTPAYMSPEQVAAERDLDPRSDVYSLGCVLYEMLTGEPPFTGSTVQAVISKRLTTAPAPVRALRQTVSVALEEVLRQALAVVPADRYATAKDFQRALGAGTAPVVALPIRRRRRAVRIGVAVGLIAAAGAVMIRNRDDAAPAANRDVVAVLPFRVTGPDSSLGYLREGMVDLLAAKLTGEGGPRAADPRAVMSVWERMSKGTSVPTADMARDVAKQLGAGRVLLGGIVGSPSRLVITASLFDVGEHEAPVEASVDGSPDSLPALIDELTAELLTRHAGESDRLSSLTSTSLQALRSYLGGQAAYRSGRNEQAVQHFTRALGHDSTFVLAAVGLFSAAYWTPDTVPFGRGKRLAWSQRERLSTRDRAFVEAWTGPRYPAPPSFAEALDGWRRAVEIAPDRPEPWFELGDVLFHFGPVLGIADAMQRASSAFDRALALDSSFAAPLAHLVELAAQSGDVNRARTLAEAYFSRDSTADAADYVRWRVAHAVGDSAAVKQLRARFRTMSTTSLRRIVGLGQVTGLAPKDVDRAADVLRQREVRPSEARLIGNELRHLALNRGRPADALRFVEAAEDPAAAMLFDALFGGGDSTAASRAAAAALLKDGEAPSELRCALALWNASRGHARAGGAASAASRHSDGAYEPRLCEAMIPLLGASADQTAIPRLARVLSESPTGTFASSPLESAARLVLARARERAGDPAGALATVRQRPYHHFGTTYLSMLVREEARLAELVGDAAAARRALQLYQSMRGR